MPCNFPVSPKIPFAEEEERKKGLSLVRLVSLLLGKRDFGREGGRATYWRDPLSNFPLDNFFSATFSTIGARKIVLLLSTLLFRLILGGQFISNMLVLWEDCRAEEASRAKIDSAAPTAPSLSAATIQLPQHLIKIFKISRNSTRLGGGGRLAQKSDHT